MNGYEIRKKDFRVIWNDMKCVKTTSEWYEMIWNTKKKRCQSDMKWYEKRKHDSRVIWNDMNCVKTTLEWYEV